MAWGLYKDGILYDMVDGFFTSKVSVKKSPTGDPLIPSRPHTIVLDLNGNAPVPPAMPVKAKPAPAAVVAATQDFYKTQVTARNLSQPDGSTCQSACIDMATNRSDIMATRNRLIALGGPRGAGDPAVMGIVLKERLGDRYAYNGNASINDMIGWLKNGEFLILHTFLTPSGHVIASDGVKDVQGSSDYFDAKDPWSEFDATSFSYNKPSINFYDGFYSARLIYAVAVAAYSFEEAISTYQSGAFNPEQGGAWIHRVLPAKKA
jgi:hypothetical protein